MIKGQLCLAIALCLSTSLAWSQEFYRYRNSEGQTVLDTKIPGQYANDGYDVLDSGGRLLEHVPAVQVLDATETEAVVVAASTEQSDQILLSSYSTVDEIDAHRLRKIQALEREISIIENDKRVTQLEIDKSVQEKSDYEARDYEVPVEMLERIDELDIIVVGLDEQLIRREAEIAAIDNEFIGKMNRFRQLKVAQQSN